MSSTGIDDVFYSLLLDAEDTESEGISPAEEVSATLEGPSKPRAGVREHSPKMPSSPPMHDDIVVARTPRPTAATPTATHGQLITFRNQMKAALGSDKNMHVMQARAFEQSHDQDQLAALVRRLKLRLEETSGRNILPLITWHDEDTTHWPLVSPLLLWGFFGDTLDTKRLNKLKKSAMQHVALEAVLEGVPLDQSTQRDSVLNSTLSMNSAPQMASTQQHDDFCAEISKLPTVARAREFIETLDKGYQAALLATAKTKLKRTCGVAVLGPLEWHEQDSTFWPEISALYLCGFYKYRICPQNLILLREYAERQGAVGLEQLPDLPSPRGSAKRRRRTADDGANPNDGSPKADTKFDDQLTTPTPVTAKSKLMKAGDSLAPACPASLEKVVPKASSPHKAEQNMRLSEIMRSGQKHGASHPKLSQHEEPASGAMVGAKKTCGSSSGVENVSPGAHEWNQVPGNTLDKDAELASTVGARSSVTAPTHNSTENTRNGPTSSPIRRGHTNASKRRASLSASPATMQSQRGPKKIKLGLPIADMLAPIPEPRKINASAGCDKATVLIAHGQPRMDKTARAPERVPLVARDSVMRSSAGPDPSSADEVLGRSPRQKHANEQRRSTLSPATTDRETKVDRPGCKAPQTEKLTGLDVDVDACTTAIASLLNPFGWCSDGVMNTTLVALNPDADRYGVMDSLYTKESFNSQPRGLQASFEALVFPVHLPNHWTAAFVHLPSRTVKVFDPLQQPRARESTYDGVEIFLQQYFPGDAPWSRVDDETGFQQHDRVNCAIFVLVYLLYRMNAMPKLPQKLWPTWRPLFASLFAVDPHQLNTVFSSITEVMVVAPSSTTIELTPDSLNRRARVLAPVGAALDNDRAHIEAARTIWSRSRTSNQRLTEVFAKEDGQHKNAVKMVGDYSDKVPLSIAEANKKMLLDNRKKVSDSYQRTRVAGLGSVEEALKRGQAVVDSQNEHLKTRKEQYEVQKEQFKDAEARFLRGYKMEQEKIWSVEQAPEHRRKHLV